MNKNLKIIDSFKDNSCQFYQNSIVDQNSISFDISKLGLIEPIRSHVNKIRFFLDQIDQLENNEKTFDLTKLKFVCKISKDLIHDYVSALDFLNYNINENNNWNDKYNEWIHEKKELERRIILEKESQLELRKKYEDDELQNQEDNEKKEKLINDLQLKLKKIETEKKQIIEEKEDLIAVHQIELSKFEKEKSKLTFLNKKIINEKELEEIENMNRKNNLMSFKKEILKMFNLANLYRKKETIFGKKFLDSLDFLRKSKYELSVSRTYIDSSINSLNLENDLNLEDLYNFNLILKEKLSLDDYEFIIDEESLINNSILCCTDNFANNFENRLFGNETFRTTSLYVSNISKSSYWVDIVSEEIFYEWVAIETRLRVIKTLLEIDQKFDHSSNQLNFVCKDQIKFMYKPGNKSLAEESFHEEIYNRFEESFTENLAKNCNLTASKDQELVKSILDTKEASFIEKNIKLSPSNSNSSWETMNILNKNKQKNTEYNSNKSSVGSSEKNSNNMSNLNLTNVFKELSSNSKELLNSTVKIEENKNLNLTFNKTEKLENFTNTSSEMSLSEDCLSLNQIPYNEFSLDSLDESDPVAMNLMMSKNDSFSNMDDYLSNIKDDSNYEIENMDLTNSQNTNPELIGKNQNKIVEQKNSNDLTFSKKKNHRYIQIKKSSAFNDMMFSNIIHSSISSFKNVIYIFYLIFIMLIYFLSQNISLKMNYSSWENCIDNLLSFFCHGFN